MTSLTVTITTTKGTHTGTVAEVCSWQAEHQGAHAEVEACGVTADVSHIDFGADGDSDAVTRAIAEELDGYTVETVGLTAEDSDRGRVSDVSLARDGRVTISWETGVRTVVAIDDSIRAV